MEKELHDKIAKVVNALDARLSLVEKKAPKPADPAPDPASDSKACSDKNCFWCRTLGDCGK